MVNASTVNSSAIHVSWGKVPCPQRNGEIAVYIVEYSRSGGNRLGDQVHVNGHTTIITGLDSLTEYIIRVAAVNGYGTGPFSDPVYVVLQTGMSLVPLDHHNY